MVTNRTRERAEELASRFGAEVVPFEELDARLADVDVLLCSTGSDTYVVSRDAIASALEQRRNRPFCLIDISVPRQIDPAAAGDRQGSTWAGEIWW